MHFLLQPVKPFPGFQIAVDVFAFGADFDALAVHAQVADALVFGFVRLAQRRAVVAGNVLHDRAKTVVVQVEQIPQAQQAGHKTRVAVFLRHAGLAERQAFHHGVKVAAMHQADLPQQAEQAGGDQLGARRAQADGLPGGLHHFAGAAGMLAAKPFRHQLAEFIHGIHRGMRASKASAGIAGVKLAGQLVQFVVFVAAQLGQVVLEAFFGQGVFQRFLRHHHADIVPVGGFQQQPGVGGGEQGEIVGKQTLDIHQDLLAV
ncbi:hypothetical protein BXU06_07670 [Aquaspirillum sp. LM1]|nr:hypothetical protein BXU06_07670 [Aquaspirillum sp. LM1]